MGSHRILRGFLLKVVYPATLFLGGFSKNLKERLQASIIRANNRLVLGERPVAKKLLILLPHCLQMDECNIRITRNIYNCEGCGRCGIAEIIDIARQRGLEISVATGGNLARRVVKETRPEAIVAVACEQDLSSGMADTYPLPVLGVTNERPFGPCLNTTVDIGALKKAISLFTAGSIQSQKND